MNKLWVYVGGCVTGALGLLAAAGLVDGAAGVASNNDTEGIGETCAEDEQGEGEEEEEEEDCKGDAGAGSVWR